MTQYLIVNDTNHEPEYSIITCDRVPKQKDIKKHLGWKHEPSAGKYVQIIPLDTIDGGEVGEKICERTYTVKGYESCKVRKRTQPPRNCQCCGGRMILVHHQ